MQVPIELVVTVVVATVGGAGAVFTALMRLSDRLSKVEALMGIVAASLGLKGERK